MKNLTKIIMLSALTLASVNSFARDTVHYLSIKDVYLMPEAKKKLDPTIKLSFGKSLSGRVVDTGIANKKTNAFNKSDVEACNWVMLSAMLALQDRAKKLGVKKVSNVISYYKKQPYKSTTKYECHAGTFVSGVALKADFVR